MTARGRWQGMLAIAQFNWPFYFAAALAGAAAIVGLLFLESTPARIGCTLAVAGALYFFVGSLGVSHWVYDQSDLYRWQWLERALDKAAIRRAIFCHSGFDEASAALRERLPSTEWIVLDHFDAMQMTEASIRRARAWYPPTSGTRPARSHAWPIDTGWADAILGILAIHELRTDADRSAWFVEARRCLGASGRVVLVEHARDIANFFAFGPGFLHFHSPRTWRRAWQSANLTAVDEFRVTPFVRVFVLMIAK